MCNPTESESGQLLTIQPCGWYIKLLSEKSQLEGRCAGMEDGIIINKATIANQSELIEKLLAENEALKQERDNMEALKDEVIRERDVAERALELMLQERDAATARAEEAEAELAGEQQHTALVELERDALLKVREAADALAGTILHIEDLRGVADFLRERIEELRQSIQEPWRVHVNDFNAAAKEMSNRTTAFGELYECTEYTSRIDAINDAAKAYKEARDE